MKGCRSALGTAYEVVSTRTEKDGELQNENRCNRRSHTGKVVSSAGWDSSPINHLLSVYLPPRVVLEELQIAIDRVASRARPDEGHVSRRDVRESN